LFPPNSSSYQRGQFPFSVLAIKAFERNHQTFSFAQDIFSNIETDFAFSKLKYSENELMKELILIM